MEGLCDGREEQIDSNQIFRWKKEDGTDLPLICTVEGKKNKKEQLVTGGHFEAKLKVPERIQNRVLHCPGGGFNLVRKQRAPDHR
eukprot:1231646-Rhodomonas_salina.2